MNKSPFTYHVQRQQGASLIIMVLAMLLLMLAVVAFTTSMSLSSLRTTNDQISSQPAVYAAESGISYARGVNNAARQILSQTTFKEGDTGWKPIQYGDLKTMLKNMCANPSTAKVPADAPSGGWGSARAEIPDPNNPGEYLTGEGFTGVKICDMDGMTPEQAELLATIVPFESKRALYEENGIKQGTVDDFFARLFAGGKQVDLGDTVVTGGLRPLALVQTNEVDGKQDYDLYFAADPIASQSSIRNAESRMVLSNTDGAPQIRRLNLEFTIDSTTVSIPGQDGVPDNFSNFGLFINEYTPDIGFYSNQNGFSGRVHTNGTWNLQSDGNSNTVKVDGFFTSTGCNTFNSTIDESGNRTDSCNPGRKGQIFNNTTRRYMSQQGMDYNGTNTDTLVDTDDASMVFDRYGKEDIYVNVAKGNEKPDFSYDYINMPINDTKQLGMATSGGIYVPGGAAEMQLSVEGSGSQKRQVINITPYVKVKKSYQKCVERNFWGTCIRWQTVEYFETGPASSPTQLGFNSSGIMEIKQGNNWLKAEQDPNSDVGWKVADNQTTDNKGVEFNGMIYAGNNIDSLSGPARRSASDSTATGGPAVASFAKITVTAANDMTITGDMKLEERHDIDNPEERENILGLYAYSGDVLLADNGRFEQNIGTWRPNAPRNLELDAFIMAGRGTFRPTRMSVDKGDVTVRGGMIKNRDAVVKMGRSGWAENYLYDKRGENTSPPGFPTYTKGADGIPADEIKHPPTDTNIITKIVITPEEANSMDPDAGALDVATPYIIEGNVLRTAVPVTTSPDRPTE